MTSDDAQRRCRAAIDEIYRTESRHSIATLVRLLGDFDLAEEALHEAFISAVESWPQAGVANPRAWLVSAGRFKAIDTVRRRARFDAYLQTLASGIDQHGDQGQPAGDEEFGDDQLRLILPVVTRRWRRRRKLPSRCTKCAG